MDTPADARSTVRVRFAPSPTGYLHIGGARTALFNWLFARHHRGVFILRIEDTDIRRSTQESIRAIIDNIRWLGLDWDEGPVLQSGRTHRYIEHAKRLVEEGKAFFSEEKRGVQPAVILKAPSGRIVVSDIIHGRVEFEPEVVGELVLMKSDGTPTYNFACVVDDSEMRISHIIRGDDHLSNTPKQLVLYEALSLPQPRFAHVPLIVGRDGSRLSKRHGATSVAQFRNEGFLPEALVNFLALLGWSPGDDREMMPLKDLVASFSLERVSRKSAVFDITKLRWLNAHYFRLKEPEQIAKLALPFFEQAGISPSEIDEGKLVEIVKLLGERYRTLRDLVDQAYYFFCETVRYDEEAVEAKLRVQGAADILEELAASLDAIEIFDKENVEEKIRGLIEERGVKPGQVIQPVRVAITGRTTSPGIFETIVMLGKERTVSRLKDALKMIV
jgi:glutamyl-tRNA synthetase